VKGPTDPTNNSLLRTDHPHLRLSSRLVCFTLYHRRALLLSRPSYFINTPSPTLSLHCKCISQLTKCDTHSINKLYTEQH